MVQTYKCPDEKHSISRSVHLSRIAAFYPKCRECVYRQDVGQLPQQTLERLQSTERRAARRSLFTEEGIRGVYLNEVTRREAEMYAAGLAALLWSKLPLIGRNPVEESPVRRPRRLGPMVVVGHDERPASPDIVIGVVAVLRRLGCSVIDVGLTTKPCFCFAVEDLQAVAGVYVTGAGCEPCWIGCDVVGVGAQPWSRGGRLDELASRCQADVSRPTRSAGPFRSYHASAAYEAVLAKHFHGIRPLAVRCACPSRRVRDVLRRMFQRIPCTLDLVPFPTTRMKMGLAPNVLFGASPIFMRDDAGVVRFGRSVDESHVHLGMLIDEDGQGCAFFDERGQMLRSEEMLGLLTESLVAETAEANVCVMSDELGRLAPTIEAAGGRCLDGGRTNETLWQMMHDQRAHLGLDRRGRYWFREGVPTCDVLLAVARVLRTLSRRELPLSAMRRAKVEDRCREDQE